MKGEERGFDWVIFACLFGPAIWALGTAIIAYVDIVSPVAKIPSLTTSQRGDFAMSRKKASSSEDQTVDEKLRAVRLELPEDVHKLLRLEAAKRDVSLAMLARDLVEQGLKSKK